MKKLIKDIVEMDKEARTELATIKEDLEKVPSYVLEQKPLIEKKYSALAEDKLNELSNKLQEEYQEKVIQTTQRFEKSVEKLTEQYNLNRERWMNEIYDDCING